MYDKGWRIICAGGVAWCARIVEILWVWTQLRGMLLHGARSVERIERHVERFEKHVKEQNIRLYVAEPINQVLT